MFRDSENWMEVGGIGDFGAGKKFSAAVNGIDLLICRDGGNYFAVENRCPHMSRPLDEAKIDGTFLKCIYHGLKMDLRTGEIIDGVGFRGLPNLRVFPVSLRDERIWVDLGDSEKND